MRALLVTAVVATETVAVPVSAVELRITVPAPPTEHVGRSVAPVGEVVSAHVSVTVPAYSVVEETVTVEDVPEPGEIEAGDVAETP